MRPIKPLKQLLVISHCILNQNAVIHGWERAGGAYPFASELLHKGVSFIQLPCPEFTVLGGNRKPMTYEEYDELKGFRRECHRMVEPIVKQIKMYLYQGYTYLGVAGIHESPNCSITGQRGVLMQGYFALCRKEGIVEKFFEVPTWYSAENVGNFEVTINDYLGEEK